MVRETLVQTGLVVELGVGREVILSDIDLLPLAPALFFPARITTPPLPFRR